MALFKFNRDYDWLGPSRTCIGCGLATWAFKKLAGIIEIPEDAAVAAEADGAGERIPEINGSADGPISMASDHPALANTLETTDARHDSDAVQSDPGKAARTRRRR